MAALLQKFKKPFFPWFLGTELQVEIMGEMREARVLSGPPVMTQPVREKQDVKKSMTASNIQ